MSDLYELNTPGGEDLAPPRPQAEHHQTDGPGPAKEGLRSRVNAALLAWGRWMDGRSGPAGTEGSDELA